MKNGANAHKRITSMLAQAGQCSSNTVRRASSQQSFCGQEGDDGFVSILLLFYNTVNGV